VRVWEGELTLPTYALLPDDPNPQFRETDGSIVYPYTMQDNLGAERADHTWRAFFLENEYLRIACLPEIGGRIQWVLDKRENEQMFYNNRVIRPGLIALRGAWVSGGIEWNRGPQGHTVTSYSPVNVTGVQNEDGSATLVIGEVEQTFRTGWEVRLTLRPGVARLDQEITIFNPTDLPYPYYFWNNTAFPQRDGTRFIYPMSLASDHFGTTFYRFPEDNGVDMTRLPNYPEPTSIFAYRAIHDFFGAYDSGDDRGIVQTADHRELPCKKGWTWGQGDDGMMNQRALTDEDGPYIEVQSGPLPTQSDYAWVFPSQEIFWREEWTPVFGLGEGFEFATPDLVVERVESDAETRFLFLATRALPGALVRLSGGGTEHSATLDLAPEAVAAVAWPGPSGGAIEVAVTVNGESVLAYRSPLEVPIEEPPVLTEAAEPTNAEEAFQAAERADKDLNRAEARRLYRRALALAPSHTDAAVGLAVQDLKAGLHGQASDRLAGITAADPEHGFARFLQAAARYRLGDDEGALDSGYLATKLAGAEAAAWRLIGRVKIRRGDPQGAIAALRRGSRDLLPLALLGAGDTERATALAERMIERGTVELIPWAVRLHTARGAERAEAAEAMAALAGEPEFAFTELLVTLAELGFTDMALDVLDALRTDGGFEPGPVLLFHAAEWAGGERAARYRQEALGAPLDYAFPSRPESLPVLRAAAEQLPASAAPRLLLGHLLGGLGRYEEAIAAWEAATALDPTLSTAHRALGMVHWKIGGRTAEAESRLRRAIAARPADQTLHRDLARLLLAEGRPADAVEALGMVPEDARRRHDVTIELARALNATGRFEETISMLGATRINFREGDATVWQLFSRAEIELGRKALGAGDAEGALTHFDRALTYPENLGVGRPFRAQEARALWFRAEALTALDRFDEAAVTLERCARNPSLSDEQAHFIARCEAAR
jgi:tetratricopeptide (TPR) repeat protein